MTTMTVTAKGQVTLRKEFLQHLGVKPGDRIHVEKLSNGRLEVTAAWGTGDIADAFGMLKRPDQPTLTIEEMNEVIANAWAGKR